jgi:ribosomal-protein-alanine N-acetyltransferase
MKVGDSINTARLVLRGLGESDATTSYLSWLNDPTILQFLEIRFKAVATINDLRDFITSVNESSDEMLFGIFLKENGKHIGNIKLSSILKQHRRADIGFLIGDKSEWFRGYASEAISAISAYAMNKLGILKVTAGCYADNVGSAKALENSGFVLEGRLKTHWISESGFQDGLLFALHRKNVG